MNHFAPRQGLSNTSHRFHIIAVKFLSSKRSGKTTSVDFRMSADVKYENNHCDKIKSNLESKAYDLMLKGRSLNAGEKFNQEAFDLLSKSIKLDPNLTEAWVELTECYQRKPDVEGAIVCLENALKYCKQREPNKIILRKLSTCIRQKSCVSQEEKVATLLRSLDLAKQALETDLDDEENHYNLAKAYMCLFFVTECVDQQLINLSRAAFEKALRLSQRKQVVSLLARMKLESDQSTIEVGQSTIEVDQKQETKCVPSDQPYCVLNQTDFLFNYASVLVYLQEFTEALEFLRLAIELDRDWDEPKKLEECLQDYLTQIVRMKSELKHNKKVVRRYSKVVESLKDVSKIEKIILADQQRLRRSTGIFIVSIALEDLQVEEDSNGSEVDHNDTSTTLENLTYLLHLKLISTINYNQAMYVTFMAIDQNYSIIVVTIYNLAADRCPNQKDIVTIVNPKMEEIQVDEVYRVPAPETPNRISFKRINVREFKDLYVNGYRISTQQVSKPQCKISVL